MANNNEHQFGAWQFIRLRRNLNQLFITSTDMELKHMVVSAVLVVALHTKVTMSI